MIDSLYTMRPMQKKDINAVYEIECMSFRTPWSLNSLKSELKNDVAKYSVTEQIDTGKVIAYAGMWVLFDEAHITNIAVATNFRGKGLGKTLMLHMMERARNSGAAKMTLEVRQNNEIAKSLYGSLGFTAYGVRKHYYSDTGEDAIIMWANISLD